MFVITNKENVLLNVSPLVEENGRYFVCANGVNYQKNLFLSYEVFTIPEGIEPFKYYYTPEKGFYPYVEPQPSDQEQSENELLMSYVIEVDYRVTMIELGLL